MPNLGKLLAVEWSPLSKQVHIQSLSETIEASLYAIHNYNQNKSVPDFLLVGVAETAEEANKLADRIEKEFK